jgi:plastocyanin
MRYILWIILAIIVIAGAWLYFIGANTEDTTMNEDMHENTDMTGATSTPDTDNAPDLGTPDVEIDLTGKPFEFSRDTIRVNEGDVVQITFTSEQGMHDFVIDEISGARTRQVNAGESDTITFVAPNAGEYEFYCSVGSHREMGMVGTLIVE